MSDDITVRADGTAEAAYAYNPAWHGLGTVVQRAPNSEDMLHLSNLDWLVEQFNMAAVNEGHIVAESDMVANVRTDNNSVLGVVSNKYQLLQNVEAFEFTDSLLMDGIMKYESAGSLRGGKVVWVLARCPDEFTIGAKDVNKLYVLFVNSFDGSHAVTCFPTDVRVVCNNTLRAAINQKQGGFSMKHTRNLHQNVSEAMKIMSGVQENFKEFGLQAVKLSKTFVDNDMVDYFTTTMFPKGSTARMEKGREAKRQIIRQEMVTPMNLSDDGVVTAWSVLNSFTAYVDHMATRKGKSDSVRAENRFQSSIIGVGAEDKVRAMKLLLTVAA